MSNHATTRRQFLKYGLYGSVAAAMPASLCLSGCQRLARNKKPNILFISIDTLRADHLGCYGYHPPTSPNIDLLAQQSHIFQRAYATIPTTLPSHLSMFTSLFPTQLSVRQNGVNIPESVTTLTQILHQNGYNTGAFVNMSNLGPRLGFDRGFQNTSVIGGPATNSIQPVCQWLKNNKDSTFFLFTHLFDPHTAYHAPQKFLSKFGALDQDEPPERSILKNYRQFTPEVIARVNAAYDAEISCADWAVGQILQQLKQLSIDKQTVVILVSDHGESLDELIPKYRYAYDHGEFLYSSQIHVPLIIHLPQQELRAASKHLDNVSMVDLMPTILDLVNIQQPDTIMMGNSLVPAINGKPLKNDRFIFSEMKPYGGVNLSLVQGDWHFIYHSNREGELYNIANDKNEQQNLYQQKPQLVKAFKGNLQKMSQTITPIHSPAGYETDPKELEYLRSLGYVQ